MGEQVELCPKCEGQVVTSEVHGNLGSFYSVDFQCDCNKAEAKPKMIDELFKRMEKEWEQKKKN